jgi:hypothetical protein
MAKYKVLTSYGGAVNATAGEIVTYANKSIIQDLLKAGYIEEAKAGKAPAEPSKASKTKTAKATKKEQKEG